MIIKIDCGYRLLRTIIIYERIALMHCSNIVKLILISTNTVNRIFPLEVNLTEEILILAIDDLAYSYMKLRIH